MNIAIFGGSFNPVHMGHYEIVRQTLINCSMDKIIIVPAHQNPLKDDQPALPEQLRWKMLQRTFAGMEEVELSDFELQKGKLSYTFKTLIYFKKQYRDGQLYLLIGEDAFSSFHLWADVDTILELAKIMVFPRPSMPIELSNRFMIDLSQKIEWIKLEIPDISATKIRTSDISRVEQNAWIHPQAMEIWKRYKKLTRLQFE
ncbi:MAG: nicotinate (nicotinamide) nucleotide adenylyltransferase [Proteobacteria bacterium]|nr:nicotinate (nicotinamide) nucleotide adenylyltransferase [Pseudomonadota bacterium]